MIMIPINKIKVESKDLDMKRSRTSFGDVNRLAESIKKCGILHPIVVDKIEGDDNYDYVLIAGERRMRAHIMLNKSEIAASLQENTTEKMRKVMELEENVARKDISWQEEIACVQQIHEIKQEEFGSATSSRDNEGWGVRQTAEMLNKAVGSISEDITLARQIQDRPDLAEQVKKLPKVAAKKVIRRAIEAEEMRQRVVDKGIDIQVTLEHGSCLELLRHVPDKSIDCLVTDPPFGHEKIQKLGTDGYNATSTNVSDIETLFSLYDELIPLLATKMREGAHVYIFTSMGSVYTKLMYLLGENGFLMDDLPLIWNKTKASVLARDYSYMSSYEAIMFGHYKVKNRRLLKPCPNIFSVPVIHPSNRVHPLQRPDDILRPLIENSTNVGEMVLDLFAGSGSTLKVSRDMQRRAIGFEIDLDNYTRAKNWLEATL